MRNETFYPARQNAAFEVDEKKKGLLRPHWFFATITPTVR